MTTPLNRVFSKAARGGQWSARALAALAILAAGPAPAMLAKADHTPSGEPVPRYVTLKITPMNARGGPGEDYKALWQYTARGLPLQVVEETENWRRVCDPEGGLGWVKKTAVDARHTVMRTGARDLPLRARPAADARTMAILASRATADLLECKGDWCRIAVDHASGWVRASEVWGTAKTPQCKGR